MNEQNYFDLNKLSKKPGSFARTKFLKIFLRIKHVKRQTFFDGRKSLFRKNLMTTGF